MNDVKQELTTEKNIETRKKFRLSKQVVIAAALVVAEIIMLIVSWNSIAFSDWYTKNVFPVFINTYGRLTSLLPISFGEILIMLAVFGIPLSLVAMIVLLIIKKGKRKKTGRVFGLVYMWIVTFVVVVQVNGCFIQYHCSSFAEINGISTSQHTHAELEMLGYKVVDKINELAEKVQRDENGQFVLTADTDETAKQAVKNLGEEFENLDGFYVTPKPVMCSFFMSQMDLMGIFFPFSLEANYNNDMYKAKLPATICHELAHTKGYIQEDEANFIAFVACDRSGNVDYEYSGYLSALTEIRNRIYSYADDETKIKFDSAISENVWNDITGNWDYWDSVKKAEDTFFDSETVSKVSNSAMEASLQVNGVADGVQSYGRMVDLMLNYFGDEI